MLSFPQAHIRTIIEAKKNNKLAIFVGAGLSKLCEKEGAVKAPSWSELVESLKSDFDYIEETDFLKIAQLYYIEFGEHQYYQRIKSLVPDGLEPSDIHRKIFEINPQCIITTNWDDVLEKVIREQGLLYDVVVSDMDLVKAQLPRMLIKMHGDFQHNNIVFKEDDYLKYSSLFPLIENYLKSILSTYVVIFVGYSYSDIDLKIILKWIEVHSKVSPPKFLLKPTKTVVEEKYLKNHGINILSPNTNEKITYKDLYDSFFFAINDLNDTLSGSIKLIADNFLNNGTISSEEKDDVLCYMFNKVSDSKEGLNKFDCLLPEQIKNKFTNCTISYHHGCFGLDFHNEYMTYDYDKYVRAIYEIFFNLLGDDKFLYRNRDKITHFLWIMLKANCVVIKNKEYFNIVDILKKINNLNFEKNNSDNLAKLVLDSDIQLNEKFGQFLKFAEKEHFEIYVAKKEYSYVLKYFSGLIQSSLKQKNYIKAIIYMFNYDNIIDFIQMDKVSETENNTLVNYKKYDYKKRLRLIPSYMTDEIEFLGDFLSFKIIYKEFYKITIELEEKRKRVIDKLSGGFSFSSNETRTELVVEQFLKFAYLNEIGVGFYNEYSNLFSSYIKNKINIQSLQGELNLLEIDGYFFVRYMKRNSGLELIVSILNSKKDIKFNFSPDFVVYLYDTFLNVYNLYINNEKFRYMYSDDISVWQKNIIILASLVKWDDQKIDEIISKLAEIIDTKKTSINIYETINNFIVSNYKIHKSSNLSKFSVLIDSILRRIANESLMGFESAVIENYIDHFYNAIYWSQDKYQNYRLVENAIFSMREASIKAKYFYIKNVFIKLYVISDEKCKGIIKDFVDKIEENKIIAEDEIFFRLNLSQYGFPVSQIFIDSFKEWLSNFDENKNKDIDFLRQGGSDYLLGLLDHLVNKSKEPEEKLKECLDILKNKVKDVGSNVNRDDRQD